MPVGPLCGVAGAPRHRPAPGLTGAADVSQTGELSFSGASEKAQLFTRASVMKESGG